MSAGYSLAVVRSMTGCDLWLLIRGSGIVRAWRAPRWMSGRSRGWW